MDLHYMSELGFGGLRVGEGSRPPLVWVTHEARIGINPSLRLHSKTVPTLGPRGGQWDVWKPS